MKCMEMYGHVWTCMEMYGNVWKCMEMSSSSAQTILRPEESGVCLYIPPVSRGHSLKMLKTYPNQTVETNPGIPNKAYPAYTETSFARITASPYLRGNHVIPPNRPSP